MSKRTETSRARKKRGDYHHGDLRRALVEAGLELVRQRGPDGLTLREAARRLGVSHAAPFRHFATKEALLAAVAEEGFRALHARLMAAGSATGLDARTRLRALGLTSFQFYVADPARFRVMFGPVASRRKEYPGLAEARAAVHALLLEALIESQRAGVIRKGDPLELGLAIAALTHGLAALVLDEQTGPLSPAAAVDLYRRAHAVLYQGIKPTAAGRE